MLPGIDAALIVRLVDITGIGALMEETLVTTSFSALVGGGGGGSVRDRLIGWRALAIIQCWATVPATPMSR